MLNNKIQNEDIVMMARTLYNKNVNPLYADDIRIATTLVCARWPASVIEPNFEAVKAMASMRFLNDMRKRNKNLERFAGA